MTTHVQGGQETDITQTLGVGAAAGRTRHFKRWLIWAAVLSVVVLVLVKWVGGNGTDKVQYKTQAAQRGNLTVLVNATGTLEPTNEVEVGSELSGTIKSVEVDYNDRVEVGQVLARLDTSKLEAEVLQSKAEVEVARASVLEARATIHEKRNELNRLKELRRLSNNKGVSQSDLDAAEAELERALADEASAKASVAKALASLELDQTDLSKAVIRSPVKGIVLERSVEPGQTVAASMETPVLFTLAEDLTKMELHVDVDEADVGQVKEGQEATFTVDAYPSFVFPGRIIQVRYGYTEEDGVVTYETVLDVNNSDLTLRPGMTGTADIVVKKIENAVLVPNAALRFSPPEKLEKEEGGSILDSLLPHPPRSAPQKEESNGNKKQQRVWMLRNGQLAAVPVTIGATDGSMTEVLAGEIEPGAALVVDTVSVAK